MPASLTDHQGRVFASAQVEADPDAVQAAVDRGARDAVAGLVPDVLLHGGRLFVRRAGLDYYEASVSVVSGPPVLSTAVGWARPDDDLAVLARRVLRADDYHEADKAWHWAVDLARGFLARVGERPATSAPRERYFWSEDKPGRFVLYRGVDGVRGIRLVAVVFAEPGDDRQYAGWRYEMSPPKGVTVCKAPMASAEVAMTEAEAAARDAWAGF